MAIDVASLYCPDLKLLPHQPTIMSTSADQNSRQNELGSPSNQAKSAANEPSIEEIRRFGDNELFRWIQQNEPNMINGDYIEKFKAERITGRAFLNHVGDKNFFRVDCDLSVVLSDDLADLANETF